MTKSASGDLVAKIVILVMLVLFSWSAYDRVQANSINNLVSTTKYRVVYVHPGDTVWSLAINSGNNAVDIREVVATIRQINELGHDADIHPGQPLKIPIR